LRVAPQFGVAMVVEENRYQELHETELRLDAALPGFARRLAIIVSAVIACLLNAGLVFGYSAIYPAFVSFNVFHDRCPADSSTDDVCPAQSLALTSMFTLATSMLNIVTLPFGTILDKVGPRANAAAMSFIVMLGSLLFAAGGYGMRSYAYSIGFFLMGICGPPVFVSTVSFGNLFPKRTGLVTAALVGAFDASSGIFVGLDLATLHGATLSQVFALYAVMPLLTCVTVLVLWPREVVERPEEPPSTPSAMQAKRLAIPDMTLREQLLRVEFWLLAWTACVGMLSINFFIASVNDQMSNVNSETAVALSGAFSALLPLGGVFSIPFVGLVMDRLGPVHGVLVLWVTLLSFSGLNALYMATGVETCAYAAFTVFVFCRPLFYTFTAAFTGHVFGFSTFGTIYGLMTSLAGLANVGVTPLQVVARSYGYGSANLCVAILQLTIVTLWLKMLSAPTVFNKNFMSDEERRRFLRSPRAHSSVTASPMLGSLGFVASPHGWRSP